MKISVAHTLCVLLSASSTDAWGWGSSSNDSAAAEEVVVPTSINSQSLQDIIHEERRFVLYNSRRLSGECLPICQETSNPTASSTPGPTKFPTSSPTLKPSNSPTASPSKTPTLSPTIKPSSNPTVSPTKVPTAKPSASPTASPSKSPTKVPTAKPSADPTGSPSKSPTNAPTDAPTGTPTLAPTNRRTAAPTIGITSETNLDCEKLQDLGYGFSEATGNPHYSGQCYPSVVGLNANNLPGRDDSIAVFVGGSYYSKNAAEVEGNMVVLGDLKVDSSGAGNFVSVGVGTHVLPNSGGECIKVGGSITASRDIQVFNQASSMYCDIVYKGSASGKDRWKTNGSVRQNPNLDLSEYEAMKTVFRNKSKYWATLPSTGTVKYEDWGNAEGQTTYQCSNNDEVQVFNVLANERKKVEGVHTIYFSNNCEGKTILINVHGSGKRKVDAAGMHFKNKQGYGPGGFENCLKSSMLWNFPDADTVDIGNGRTSEFQGSLLVTGNLEMTTTGQSGRTIILGDITHNRGGSEFHSYEFNPPKPLPDPDCKDLMSGDISINNGGGDSSSNTQPAPTNKPTNAPTQPLGECKSIPQNRLPSGSWATSDSECNKCKPPNNVKWYPCNTNPPLCEGNCKFNI